MNLFIPLITLVFVSCGTAGSSRVDCGQGASYIEQDDFYSALEQYKRSVRDFPSSSNYDGLAKAYDGLGSFDKAWEASCKAVSLDLNNSDAVRTNKNLFLKYIKPNCQLDIKGQSLKTVVDRVGQPCEAWINRDKSQAYLMYGTVCLKFEGTRYVGWEWRNSQASDKTEWSPMVKDDFFR